MDSSSTPTEESSGCSLAPQYEEGDCCAVHLGVIELKDGRVFKGVILEFPAGPPKLPISVVWDGTPLTLSIKEK